MSDPEIQVFDDPAEPVAQMLVEAARRGEADPNAGEAAGADADHEHVEITRMGSALSQERVDVFEQRDGAGDALSEHLVVVEQRARRAVRRRIKRQRQHSSIDTILLAPSGVWRRRTA